MCALIGQFQRSIGEKAYKRPKTIKNRDPKEITLEINEELRAVIERTKRIPGHRLSLNHIFRNKKGQAYTVDGFESNFQRLKKKVGLEHPEVKDIQLRDFRAKAATDKIRAEGKEAGQMMLGHSQITTTDIYDRKRPDDRVKPNPKITANGGK